MCGIIGVASFGNVVEENPEVEKDRRISLLKFSVDLLEQTEDRGKNATGIISLFEDGMFFGQKMGVRAAEFIGRYGGKSEDFDALITVIREYHSPMRIFLGHCRKISVGSVANVNNHPIKTGNVLGVHNGTLRNHDLIFENIKSKRDGEVDSEAIFALLRYFTKDCTDPFTTEILVETCKRLEGTFSFLALNANNPNQLVTARDGRPAEYCLIKPLKSILIASEKKFIERALWEYNKFAYLFPHSRFSKLKESDVEFFSPADDSGAIFDLTTEITPTTRIADLCTTVTIPRATQRIWTVPSKTTVYQNGYNSYTPNTNYAYGANERAADQTKTAGSSDEDKEGKKSGVAGQSTSIKEEPTTQRSSILTKDATNNSNREIKGRIWNAALDKYVTAWGNVQSTANGALMLLEKKHVASLEEGFDGLKGAPAGKDVIVLDKTEPTPVDKSVPIIHDAEVFNGIIELTDCENCASSPKSVPLTIVKPVVSLKCEVRTGMQLEPTDPSSHVLALEDGKEKAQILRAAAIAFKDAPRFSSETNIAEICDLKCNPKSLTLVGLANRIVSAVFNTIFQLGWNACRASLREVTVVDEKLKKAETKIRVLKQLTSCFQLIVAKEEVKDSSIQDAIEAWSGFVGARSELTSENLEAIFRKSELSTNNVLKVITKTSK